MQSLPKTSQSSYCQNGHQLSSDQTIEQAIEQTIGQLFGDYGERYILLFKPSLATIKLIRSIRVCRTPVLGGQQFICESCGDVRTQYYSCGNSQCPQCQGIKRMQWQDRLSSRMLNVPYAHVTFTLPHELNGVARRNPHKIYGLLMRSCWLTIKQLCKKEEHLGALPGMTAVLHT